MKFFVLVSFLVALAFNAGANELALLGGIRSSSGETDINAASVSSDPDLQGGALVNMDFTRSWILRTGVILTQRQLTLKPTAAGIVDLNFTYMDVPLTAMYKFSYAGRVFAGPVLAFNLGKDTTCSSRPGCAPQNVESMIFPWQLGLSFRLIYQLGAEIYYEYLPGNLEKNVSNVRTVGANILYYFD